MRCEQVVIMMALDGSKACMAKQMQPVEPPLTHLFRLLPPTDPDTPCVRSDRSAHAWHGAHAAAVTAELTAVTNTIPGALRLQSEPPTAL